MHRYTIKFKIIILSTLLIYACKQDPLQVDISNIDVNIQVKHFHKDFYSLKEFTENDSVFNLKLQELQTKYGSFFFDWIYMPEIMGIGHPDSASSHEVLKAMLSSSSYAMLMERILGSFDDFSVYENQFKQAYKRFRFYFPENEIPDIITYVANFSLSMNPVGNGYIGVALEMHMGDTFMFYQMLNPPIENYFLKLLNPETILPMHFWAHGADLFARTNKGSRFSDELFFWGKLLYFTEAMLPEVPKHLIIGYTSEEYKICMEDEKEIWTYFIKEDVLYSSDKKRYMRFFNEGPHTAAPNVPPNTPPMIGKFAGWQAVRAFMKKFPQTTLSELMEMDDSEAFLRKVKYKP